MIFSVESIKRWLASMKASSRRRKAAAKRRPTTLQIENLEPRHLMAVDQTVDDAGTAFSLVGDWTTVSDSSSVGTAYHQFAGGAESTGSATWTFSDLEVGKHYEFLTTWADDATGSAAYSILDGGTVDATKSLDQSQDVQPAAAGETGWRSLGVVTADHTELSIKLTASSGITADAVRIVEVTGGLIRELDAGERDVATVVRPDGSYVVVWEAFGDETWGASGGTYSHDTSGSTGIVAQIISAGGVKLSPAFLVNQYTDYGQINPAVDVAADGSFVIAWQSNQGTGGGEGSGGVSGTPEWHVFARRFDALGSAQGDEFQVAEGDGKAVDVAIGADGGFLVAGAQSYWNADGIWRVPEGVANGSGQGWGVGGGYYSMGSWVGDETYYGDPGEAMAIFAHRYDSTGTSLESQRLALGSYDASSAVVEALSNGSFVVGWSTRAGYSSGDFTWFTTIDSLGVAASEQVVQPVSAYESTSPVVAATTDGDFLLAWEDIWGYSARRSSPGGFPVAPLHATWQAIPVPSDGSDGFSLAPTSDGGFLLLRQTVATDGKRNVYAQKLDSEGKAVEKEYRVGPAGTDERVEPYVGRTASGEVVLLWTSLSTDPAIRGVHVSSPVETNTAPTTTGLANVTSNEDAAPVVDLWAAFDDVQNFDRDLSYSVVANSNPTIAPTLTIRTADGKLELLPASNLFGTASITIRATDKQGLYVDSQFQWTVAAQPDAPTVVALPANPTPGEPMALNLTVSLVDPDGSETLGDVTISGVPTGATLSAGADLGGGQWKVAPTALAGLALTLPENATTPFRLTISAGSTESSTGATATTTLQTRLIPVAGAQVWTVDDLDVGFEAVGDWTTASDAASLEGGRQVFAGGAEDAGSARWTFSGLEAGRRYELFVSWSGGGAADAVYEVFDGGTSTGVVHGDQTTAAGDYVADGVHWKSLGVYLAASTELVVELNAEGASGVVADAARVRALTPTVVKEFAGVGAPYVAATAVRADGSMVVVWDTSAAESWTTGSGRSTSVGVQIFDKYGNAQTAVVPVYREGKLDQSRPTVAVRDDGSFVVVWSSYVPPEGSGSGYGWTSGNYPEPYGQHAFGRLFNAAGVPTGHPFDVGQTSGQDVDVVFRSDGAFVVVGQDYYLNSDGWMSFWGTGSGSSSSASSGWYGSSGIAMQVFAHWYGATGADYGRSILRSAAPYLDSATAAFTGNNGFVAAWGDGYYNATQFTGPGVNQGTAERGNVGDGLDLAGTADGGWILARANSWNGLAVQRFGADGQSIGGDISIAGAGATDPVVTSLDDGGFIVAWEASDGAGMDVFVQRFDAAGRAVAPAFRANPSTAGDQRDPNLAKTDDGHVVVTWTTFSSVAAERGVYSLKFVGTGADEAGTPDPIAPEAVDGSLSLVEDQTNGVVDLNALFSDADGSDAALAYSVVGTGGLTFPTRTIDPLTGRLSVAAAADASGSGWIKVRATDAGGLYAESKITIDVAAIADAPLLSVSPASGSEDSAVSLAISAALADTDGSESLQVVTISGAPTGAVLSAGEFNDGVWKVAAGSLAGLKLTAPANFNGDFDLKIVATSVEASNGDYETVEKTLSVSIASVDDLTTLVAPASLSAVEDVSKAVAGLVLADVDAAEGTYKISLSVAHGTLSLGETSGLTFLENTASGDAELVFSGSFVAVNAALATLAYLGSENYSGEDAIHVEAVELGEEGEEDVDLGEADVEVTVAAVADAPVVTAASAGGDEDTTIAVTISAGLADADGSEALQDVLISGVPTGATLSAGTNLGDGTWKLTSTQLAGLKVTPAANFSGSLELTVKATSTESVGGGTAATSKTFSVAVAPVDDATTLSAPATLTTSKNVSASVVGVHLADVDGTASGYQVAISAAHGALSLGTATGLTFTTGSAAGGAELVFHGTFVAVNAALATLSYKGATGYYGADAIAVHAEEFGGGSAVVGEASIAVTVIDVIYPPTLTVVPASGLEDSAVPLSIALATGYTALCSIRIEGVPTGATLSAGTHEEDGSWTLAPAQLTGLTLSLAANAGGVFDLTVKAFDGSGEALVSTTKTLHVVVSAVNDAPTLSGFGLVESTGEPGALTASNAKVHGTIADVEGKGFFYVDFDLDVDGKVDQTFSTAPGAFEADLASLLKAGATTVKARASEYDVATGKTIAGAWQTLTFTYAPVANAAPTTTDLALSGTPVEAGNVVHAAPLLQGKLTDGALAGAAYFAELDLNGDDAADLMSLAKTDGTFSFNLNGLVDLGEQTVRVRGVEVDPQTFEYLYGEWASLKFTFAAAVNALPQISGLALVVDTDAADGVTSDPRITGTLTDPDSTGAGYYVEIDLGQDGTVDDKVQVKAGQAFTYDPTSRIAIGDLKLAVRGVEWKGNADPLRGEWSKFQFEYTGEPTSPPEILGLALVRDTGTQGDGTSFDPRITGTLADSTANGYSYTLEVDFDQNGEYDDQITVQPGTSFVYDPASYATVGTHKYSFRGVERTTVNGVDEIATSDWVDFSFTRIAVPVVAPTLSNLHLVNDTDGAGDGLTTDARVAVEVGSTETDGSVYYQIEIDLDGDGFGEQSVQATPGTVFVFDPASMSLAPGEYTLKMRSTASGDAGNDASGWEQVSFEYVVPVSFDPRVNALRLENDTDYGFDRVTSDPRLTGFAVDGDRMGVSYTLEVDVDGDGDADFSQAATLGADFVVDPSSYLEYGKHSVGVRVVETLQGIGDDLAHAAKVTLAPSGPYTIRAAIGDESLASDQDVFRVDLLAGQTLTLDVDAQSIGGSPAFSGLDSYLKILDAAGVELAANADEQDEYGNTVGSDPKLTFTAAADGAYYIVLSADTTWSTATAGAYYLNLAVDSGTVTTSGATLPSVTHRASAWSTVEFTYTPPSAATLPHGARTDEDAPLTFTGGSAIVVHSVPSGEASVTLTVAHGMLALGGDDSGLASLTGDGTGTVVLSGTIEAINAALASLTFTSDSDYYGAANVSVAVQELNPASGLGEHRTSEFDVEVRAINDAPTVSTPAALSTTEDAAVAFDASHRIVVADAESATGTLSVTLRAEHGSLHLGQPAAGLSTLQGDGSSTLTLIGTAAQVNASLESLVFTPEQDYGGAASVKVVVEDRGNFGTGGPLSAEGTVSISVAGANDAPLIVAPTSKTVDKNHALVLTDFTGISIQDVDAGANPISVTLSAAHGVLQALGGQEGLDSITGDGTAALTLVGTLAAVNVALTSVRYTPTSDFVGWDAIAVSVDDQGSGVAGATGAVGTDSVRIFVNEVWTAPTTEVAPPPAGPTAEEVQTQYDAAMLALVNASTAAASAAQGILDSSLSSADVARAAALASAAASLQTALDAAQAVAVGSNTTALNALKAALGNGYDLLQPFLVADFAWPDQPAAPTISTSPVDVPSPQTSGPSFDPTSNLLYKALMVVEKGILLQARFNLDSAYRGAESNAQNVKNEAMAAADEAWSEAYEDVLADYETAMAAAGQILDALAGVQAHHDSQMNEASQMRNDAYHAAYQTRAEEQGEAWGDFWDRVNGGLDSEEYIHASYDLNVALDKAAAKYTKAMADADDAYARKSIETRRDLYVGLGEVDDAWVAAISSASLQLARDTAEIDLTRAESKAAAERIYDEKIAVAAHVRDTGLAEAAAAYARDDLTFQQAAVATWAQAAGPSGSDARNWADYQKNLASVRTVAALEVVEASRVLSLGAVDAAKARGLANAASHETQKREAAAAAADRDVARAQAADQETQDRLEAQATHREQNADAQSSRDEALASAVLDYTKGIADEQLTRDTTHAETNRDHLLADLAAWRRYEQNHDSEQYTDACDENSLRHLEKSAETDRAFRNAALDKGETLDDAVFSAVDDYREAVGTNNAARRKADVEAIGVHVVGSATADADYAVAIADSIHNENVARAAHERDEANVVIGLQLTYANAAALTTSEAAVAAAEESQFYYDDVWDALVERLTPDPEAPPSPDAQYKLDLATAARDRVAAQGIALTDAATDAAEAQLTRDLAVAAASALMSYSLADDEYQGDVALSQATRDRVSAKATAPIAAAGGGGGAAAVKFMAAFAPERWVDSWWTDYIDRWWKRDAIYADLSRTMAEATRTRARTNSDAQYEYESLSITDEERVERGVEAQEVYDQTYSKAFKELQTRLAEFDLSAESEGSRAKGLRESGAAETRLGAATAMIAADRDWETASAQATLEYETEIAEAQHVYSDAYTAAEDFVDRALAGIAKTRSNAFAVADSEAYLASEQADRTWTLTMWQQKESELGTSSGSDAALQEYQYKYAGAQVAWLIAKHQADSAYADATAETNLYLAQTSAAAAYDLAIVQIAAGTTRSYSDAVAAETSTVSDATATFERVRDDSISTYDYRVGVATLKTSHETAVQKAEASLVAAQQEAQLKAALARIDAAKTLRDSNHSTEAQNAYDNAVSQANEQAEDEFRKAYTPYLAAVGAAYTAMIVGLGQKDVTWATEVATHQKDMVVHQNEAETIYTAALRSSATIERDSLAPAESTYVAAVATAQRDAVMALANARNVQMRAMAPRDSGDPTLVAEPRLPSEVAGVGPTEAFANAVAEAEADYHASKAHAAALTKPVDTFERIVGMENEEVFGVLKSFYAYYAGVLAKADADFNRDEAAAEGKAAVAAANASLDQTLTKSAAGAVLSSAGWILDSALAVANEAADHALSEASAVADVDSVAETAQARADYAAAIAKAQVKFNVAVAKLQIAENQSGYNDAVDALGEGKAKALGEAAVEQAVRLGSAAVKWVESAAQASVTQFNSLSEAMTTHAVGVKAASLVYSTAVAGAEYTATVALGDAQATLWVDLAQAAEKKDLAGRLADLEFQKEVATENAERVAEIVAQAGVYASSITAGTPLGTEFANYNTYRVALAQAWKEWAEEAETEGQDSAETAAGARTTYAQTMADAYRTMVGFEASEVQTASVALATKQADEVQSLVQASAADLLVMAPLEKKYRVDVAEAEKAYQKSMAEAAPKENRTELEEEAGDARTEALKRLRDAYARDEQQAALTYAQSVASAQNTSAQGQAQIQKTRALTASAVLKDFTQTQKTAATTRVETEADAEYDAAKDDAGSWKDKTAALRDAGGSGATPFAAYEASIAANGEIRSNAKMAAARDNLKVTVAADQLAVVQKRSGELDFAQKSTQQESQWLIDAVEKATTKNVGQVQAMGAKTASGEYDPDLLFETPNSPIAANAGQAAADLGSGGTPSHGWNPGTYVGYDGDWGWYGWYNVGPWNEGATSVSPDSGIAWTYGGSYGYGYDGFLGGWDPWYGDGWYGDVASASSYGEFSYSQLSSLTAEPGYAAEVAKTYGLPEAATDKPASTAEPPESTTQPEGPSVGRGSLMFELAAAAVNGDVSESSRGFQIEAATVAAPEPTDEADALAARFGGILAQKLPRLEFETVQDQNAPFEINSHRPNLVLIDSGPVHGGWTPGGLLTAFRARYANDAKALQTLEVADKLGFKIQRGTDLWMYKYHVDPQKRIIYIADDWNLFFSRSNENAAGLLYSALSDEFYKYTGLEETWEHAAYRVGGGVVEVVGGHVAIVLSAPTMLAPEPTGGTKVLAVGFFVYGINSNVHGFTSIFNRGGGVDLAHEIPSRIGFDIGGENGRLAAQRMEGTVRLSVAGLGLLSQTNTGMAKLGELKSAMGRDAAYMTQWFRRGGSDPTARALAGQGDPDLSTADSLTLLQSLASVGRSPAQPKALYTVKGNTSLILGPLENPNKEIVLRGVVEGRVWFSWLKNPPWWMSMRKLHSSTEEMTLYIFVDDAAKLGQQVPAVGPYTLMKRLFGQYNGRQMGDIIIDGAHMTQVKLPNGMREVTVRVAQFAPRHAPFVGEHQSVLYAHSKAWVRLAGEYLIPGGAAALTWNYWDSIRPGIIFDYWAGVLSDPRRAIDDLFR